MTDRERRSRLATLAVAASTALGLAGAWAVVVTTDRAAETPDLPASPSVPAEAATARPVVLAAARPAIAGEQPPVVGLRPAAAPPRRRVVVVRRSRAS